MRALLGLILTLLVPTVASAAAMCENLTLISGSNFAVTTAIVVKAGEFTPPAGRAGGASGANSFAKLPAFCRVAATLKPSPRSNINMEVWLPVDGWNNKLEVVGNGNFAGTISYPAMATALAAGYATASTDTGHSGSSSNTFANQDVIIDFAYRAVHETAVTARKTVETFYGSSPKSTYFNGCSTGGRQALTEAQRFPDDFDGIVAGAPAINGLKQTFGQIWIYQATASPATQLSKEKLQALHQAVLDACDANDGVKDGVLENPLSCKFDPKVLACKGAEAASCLTLAQVEAVRKIYAGASNPRTGAPIFPGLERGSELGWSQMPVSYAVDFLREAIIKKPNWDPKTLNFDFDLTRAMHTENARVFDATDPNLDRFTGHGGRLLMYQGWAEQGIPPRYLVTYYDEVRQHTKAASDNVRLFMVPGMQHCGGGDGTSTFDMVAALDQWTTTGKAPENIPASRVRNGAADRTRPLCAWPQVATYNGSGSTDEAKNFVCK